MVANLGIHARTVITLYYAYIWLYFASTITAKYPNVLISPPIIEM